MGELFTAGVFLRNPYEFELNNYIRMKDTFRECIVALNLKGQLEAVNDMHHWAIRIGTAEGGDVLDVLVAQGLVDVLADGVTGSKVIDSGEAEIQGFMRLKKLGEHVRQKVRDRQAGTMDPLAEIDPVTGAPKDPSRDMFSVLAEIMEETNRAWLTEPDWVARELKPIFEEMAKFDYTNPAAFAEE